MINILFLGDIVGRPGRNIAKQLIPVLKTEHGIDFIIANGENSAGGAGIDPNTADELFSFGIDVLTTGNHIWKRKEIIEYLERNRERIIRPLNYPPGVPGAGSAGFTVNKDGKDTKIRVVNLIGRTFMDEIADCPFRTIEKSIQEHDADEIVLVDFHAEATSEKNALAWFLDGKVTVLVGTHTHIQTADERLLPKGLAYITDVGMCGLIDSILGVEPQPIVSNFLTGMPVRFEVPKKGASLLNGVIIECDEMSGKAIRIERIREFAE